MVIFYYNLYMFIEMCPPLLSDSLNIICTRNGEYANCSNLPIPGTIASPSCKPIYIQPNTHKKTPLELHCLSNGTWNEQLYTCNTCNCHFYLINIIVINFYRYH